MLKRAALCFALNLIVPAFQFVVAFSSGDIEGKLAFEEIGALVLPLFVFAVQSVIFAKAKDRTWQPMAGGALFALASLPSTLVLGYWQIDPTRLITSAFGSSGPDRSYFIESALVSVCWSAFAFVVGFCITVVRARKAKRAVATLCVVASFSAFSYGVHLARVDYALIVFLTQDRFEHHWAGAAKSTLVMKSTAFDGPCAITRDASSGNLFVSDVSPANIWQYAVASRGDLRKIRTAYATLPEEPCLLASDHRGGLYVVPNGTDRPIFHYVEKGNDFVIDSTISAEMLSGEQPSTVGVDGNGNVYVATMSHIYVFQHTFRSGDKPIRSIDVYLGETRPRTTRFVDVDAAGDVFIGSIGYDYPSSSIGSVSVFAAGAYGAATPARIIAGSRTRLMETYSMTVTGQGDVVFALRDGDVDRFPAGSSGNVEPATLVNGPQSLNAVQIAVGRNAIFIVDYGRGVDRFDLSPTNPQTPRLNVQGW